MKMEERAGERRRLVHRATSAWPTSEVGFNNGMNRLRSYPWSSWAPWRFIGTTGFRLGKFRGPDRDRTRCWSNAGAFDSLGALMNVFLNQRARYVLSELGQIALLARDIFVSALTFKVVWRDFVYQI